MWSKHCDAVRMLIGRCSMLTDFLSTVAKGLVWQGLYGIFNCFVGTFINMVQVIQIYTIERSRSLVKLARKYGVLLFAEDVYNMLHYDDATHCPPRLLAYDDRY